MAEDKRENRNFGSWLREQRKLLGLTTRELGDRIGCSAATVEKIEAGTRSPSAQLASLFADFFGVAPEAHQAFSLFARGMSTPAPPGRVSGQSLPGESVPNNLPSPPGAFIGRESSMADLQTLLQEPGVRLLSLTGPPGAGKTRLALRAATASLDHFPDGVFFVALASLRDPGLLLSTVAQALGIREEAEQPLAQALKSRLKAQRVLLVLDNFEQVMAAGHALADLILSVPGLQVLVTTRQVLHLYGEYNYPVSGLSTPQESRIEQLSVEELSRYEAVQLFAHRAAAARHGFRLTSENAYAVARICVRLDGLPLAIELAAAQVASLHPREIQSRLDGMMDFLVDGPRDLPARQRTLSAAIEWSYSLLNEQEAALFRCLSVFLGGCTAEAVAEVFGRLSPGGTHERPEYEDGGQPEQPPRATGPAARVPDILAALCDKSLLRQEDSRGERRFQMLETLREYAEERLLESGEADAYQARRNHAMYYLALVERAEPRLRGAEQGEWLERLERDHNNLRAALEWMEASDLEAAQRMCGALWLFWEVRGYVSEGRTWSTRVLVKSSTAPTKARADALHVAGRLAFLQGSFAEAHNLFGESLAIRRDLGDRAGIATSLNNLGIVAFDTGDYEGARRFYEESVAMRRELGDKYGVAALLNNMANAVFAQGDYGRARTLHEESLALRREAGNEYGIASSLQNLGVLAMHEGSYQSAERLFEESLEIRRRLGDKDGVSSLLHNLGQAGYLRQEYASARTYSKQSLELYEQLNSKQGIVVCLILLGQVATWCGEGERAARLFGAASVMAEDVGFKLFAADREEYDRSLREAMSQLSEADWARLWDQGRAMKQDDAVAYALGRTTRSE